MCLDRNKFPVFSQTCRNVLCIPESFNIAFSTSFFYCKITFVNSQHTQTNSKGYL